MKKIVFASSNNGKIEEIKSIFSNYNIVSLKEIGIDINVEEDENTFYGNALKKAKAIYNIANIPVIADDSGIEILSLNGWPGVLTHRFLGENVTDRERNEVILQKVKNLSDRSIKFVCDLVYYDGNNIVYGEGVLLGKVAYKCRGNNGFGFDEIFELENGKTLAELSKEEKNSCSARKVAANCLKNKLEEELKKR